MSDPELSIQQKLNQETGKISWKELEVFFAKGNLLQVDPGEDLIRVAELIAQNDSQSVKTLIESHKIAFATPEWVRANCIDSTALWSVVVAPYVLCQLIKTPPELHH